MQRDERRPVGAQLGELAASRRADDLGLEGVEAVVEFGDNGEEAVRQGVGHLVEDRRGTDGQ